MSNHLIFVYGTLKRGGPNNHILNESGIWYMPTKAKFIGEFVTEPLYRLYTYYGLPCLVNYQAPGCRRCNSFADCKHGYCHCHCPHEFPSCPTKHFKGRHIKGEVYEVDEDLLEYLDRFEGVLYERRPIKLNGIEGVEAYFYKRPINQMEYISCGSEFKFEKGEIA